MIRLADGTPPSDQQREDSLVEGLDSLVSEVMAFRAEARKELGLDRKLGVDQTRAIAELSERICERLGDDREHGGIELTISRFLLSERLEFKSVLGGDKKSPRAID